MNVYKISSVFLFLNVIAKREREGERAEREAGMREVRDQEEKTRSEEGEITTKDRIIVSVRESEKMSRGEEETGRRKGGGGRRNREGGRKRFRDHNMPIS